MPETRTITNTISLYKGYHTPTQTVIWQRHLPAIAYPILGFCHPWSLWPRRADSNSLCNPNLDLKTSNSLTMLVAHHVIGIPITVQANSEGFHLWKVTLVILINSSNRKQIHYPLCTGDAE
jgi:hypothetical protein